MKKSLSALLSQSRPFTFAAAGFLFGVLLFAFLGYDAFGQMPPPLASAFLFSRPALALIADFAGEAKLFLLMALLSLALKNPLPALLLLALRGLYFGLSASYLYGAAPLTLYFAYTLLTAAVLVAYAAVADAALVFLSKEKRAEKRPEAQKETQKQALSLFGFTFFYFTGVIFLLVVIRNLIYLLLLSR